MKRLTLLAAGLAILACGSAAWSGPVDGRGTGVGKALAYGKVTFYETFRGGEWANIGLVGDGATDLDVFVYDPSGRLVGKGVSPTDIELVRIYVPERGRYRIEVVNLGSTWNRFVLMTE